VGGDSRAPVDLVRPVTLTEDWTEQDKAEATQGGFVDDRLPGLGAMVHTFQMQPDGRFAKDLSPHQLAKIRLLIEDPNDRDPVRLRRKQELFWQGYDQVSPNDSGEARIKDDFAAPRDLDKTLPLSAFRTTDSTVPSALDPVVGLHPAPFYHPGNPRHNLNLLFPPSDGLEGNRDPLIKYLDHSLAEHKDAKQTPRHYFPIPSHKMIRVPDRAGGRYNGEMSRWDDFIRGRRYDTGHTIILDKSIENYDRNDEGTNGLDPHELGEPVAKRPSVRLQGNLGSEYTENRGEAEFYDPYPRLQENPFQPRSRSSDYN
jgi:hypothetical protein